VAMGEPSVQALPAERWRVPARLAAHWLASSCRLGAGGASNYSLEGRDYLCARTAWHRFRRFGETFAGNALVPVDAVSGDDDEGGQQSCSTMCASDAVARNSTLIERGVLRGTRIRWYRQSCC